MGINMARYFELAKGMKPLLQSNNFPWPYEVSLCFEGVARPVGFSEGTGTGNAGGIFTAAEALQPEWSEHFKYANGEWLLPFVRRMAAGECVDAEEALRVYRESHGREPLSYEYKMI